MTKQKIPLNIYSRWMWIAVIIVFLSYAIVLSRTADSDVITAFFVFILSASSIILGYRISNEDMAYRSSIEAK